LRAPLHQRPFTIEKSLSGKKIQLKSIQAFGLLTLRPGNLNNHVGDTLPTDGDREI